MADFTRRGFLRLAGAAGTLPAMTWLAGCGDASGVPLAPEFEAPLGPEGLFSHGVASGDPLQDSVILWTRVSPAEPGPVDVFWEVARDEAFEDRVGAGIVTTDADRDYTVKLDAVDLAAGSTWYYRFHAQGRVSQVLDAALGSRAGAAHRRHLRFGVVSCSRYTGGFFHAYRRLAQRPELDAILHLGDYIYESGGGSGERRHDPPREIISLEDYRTRYAQYRADPDLQAAHQMFPFITVWDDHESANNSWRDGASAHDESSEGSWAERRARAERVYSEWMPIRDQATGQIWRELSFGDLATIVMLDTRLWGRDLQAAGTTDIDVIADPSRTLLGGDQEAWLEERLRDSQGKWKLVGQQVVMAQWKLQGAPNSEGGGLIANEDQWDGYRESQRRVFDMVRRNDVQNLVVLTGDVHSSWAHDLTEDPNNPDAYDPVTGEGSLGVEFVAPGVTSSFFAPGVEAVFMAEGPHIKYGETRSRGYLILDVSPERSEATWFHFDDVSGPTAIERQSPTFRVRDGAQRLESV